MELPKTDSKLFEGKVKDVLQEMIACKEHMQEHYPFEDRKDRNVPKEMKKVKARKAEIDQELARAASKEAQDKVRPQLKELGDLLKMLIAINDLDGKIMDLEDLEPDEDFSEKLDIFTVEAQKEEPVINAVFEQCKLHFRLAKDMPSSFEKSFMKINYCLALLSQEDQIDEFLGLKKKEQKLERLREELKKILHLMKKEQVDDQILKELLHRMVAYYMSNVPTIEECEQDLKELVNSLKQLRTFFFQEFFDLVQVCDKNSGLIKEKNIILLLGTTGCGKSTTIQYLSGAKMRERKDGHIQAHPMPKNLEEFISSIEKRSITRYIHPFKMDYINSLEETENIFIVDTPGFGDTQGLEVDISNCIGIIKAVGESRSVYPVIIFNEQNQGGRCELMKEQIAFYSSMIKGLSIEENNSVNFFFSHYAQGQNLAELIQAILKALNAKEQLDIGLTTVLKKMKVLGDKSKMVILDPLDGKGRKILDKILETDPIYNPRSNFSLALKQSSKLSLNKQIGLHEQFILDSLNNNGVEIALISHKIHELQKFAEIFEPYDETYSERVGKLREQLLSRVEGQAESVKRRATQCMEHGTKLLDQDITSFKEAIEYELKMTPVLAEFNQQNKKAPDDKIQSDQGKITQVLLNNCKQAVTNLFNNVPISDDKWFAYMEKTGRLAQQIKGCEDVQKIAFNQYSQKLNEQVNIAENAIKQTNIAQNSSGSSSYSIQQEEIKGREEKVLPSTSNMHLRFASVIHSLYIGRDKAKDSNYNKIAEEIQKRIASAVDKLKDLDKIIEPAFKICYQDFESDSYTPFNGEHIKNINLAFSQLSSFQSSCKLISKEIDDFLNSLQDKYTQICVGVVKALKNKIQSLLQNGNADHSQEVKNIFGEIKLVRTIDIIKNETQVLHKQVLMLMENQGLKKVNIELLNDLYFQFLSTQETQASAEFKNVIEDRIKRLNESLKSLKILQITYSDPSKFKEKIMIDIINGFNLLLEQIGIQGDLFVSNLKKKNQYLAHIGNLYDIIQQLYQVCSDHNIDVQKNEIGQSWLQYIKSILQQIREQSGQFSGKLMIYSDYRSLETSIAFLHQFTEGIVSPNINRLIKAIKVKFADPNDPSSSLIDPKNIIDQLNKLLTPQLKILIETFDESLSQLIAITTVKNFEERKVEPENQFKNEVQKLAKKILMLFKLANEIKNRNPKCLQKILEEEQPENEDYILAYFSEQFREKYLIELEQQRLQNNRLWIFLKHESMKQLKDLDLYMIPQGDKASKSYINLDEKFFLNQDEEILKAQEKFQKGEYMFIVELLEKLSKGIINDNAANISAKIKEYIIFKTTQIIDTLQNQEDVDYQLTNETAKFFSLNSETLLKIHAQLGQYIIIKGDTIVQIIEKQVIPYLEKCFQIKSKEIENTLPVLNYSDALEKIDQMNLLSRNLYQDAGNELRTKLKSLYEGITKLGRENIQQIIDSIKENCDKIKSRDIAQQKMKKPLAKAFYEKISQIKKQPQITQLSDIFIKDLEEKYEQKCSQIEEKLQNKQIEEIQNVKKDAKQVLDSLKFMPDQIKDIIEPKINELLEKYDNNLKEELRGLDQEIERTMKTNIDPLKFSNEYLIKYRDSTINSELFQQIKTFLRTKVSAIVTKINDSLNERQLDQVISVLLPLLISYMNDTRLSEYIFHENSENLQKIYNKIQKLFTEATIELSYFFQKTHNKSGDVIQTKFLQHDKFIGYPDHTSSIRVLRDLIKNRDTQMTTIQECIPELVEKLKNLILIAIKYLREIKSQFQLSFKQGQFQECISQMSNMKFTNHLFNNDFMLFLNQLQNICEQEQKMLLNEIQLAYFDKIEEEIITELIKSKDFIINCKFIDINRSAQVDMDKFYKTFYKHYDMIVKASLTEQKSPLHDKSNSQIAHIHKEVQQKFEKNMGDAEKTISELNILIEKDAIISQDQLDQFDCHFKSFSSMERQFIEHRRKAEDIIKDTKSKLNQRLLDLEKEAKSHYADQQVNLNKLAINLSKIQKMSENITLFEDQIKKTLDRVFQDYGEKRSKDSKAAIDLQQELRALPGSYAANIAQNHVFFKGTNILDANKKFQSKPCEQVKDEIKGDELKQREKDDLEQFYNDFLVVYSSIIEEKLIPRKDRDGKSIPVDLSDIKTNIKQKFSSQDQRKWVEKDIYSPIRFGNPVREYKKLVFLLANIFAMWSLMNSEHYKKAEEMNEFQAKANLKGYLLQPHVAQIFSIVRILGFGYAAKYKHGSKFSSYWKKLFEEPSNIRNNLVQIKTGEGKSITLAVVSIVFALNGFEVKCACYSKYLSQRDYESFESMFRELGVQDLIEYGTFNEVAEMQINREGDIREIGRSLVLKKGILQNKPAINLDTNKRPQVLLIDEVDVFFSPSFFGNVYIPAAEIKHDAISNLCDHIWKERQNKIQELGLMSEEDQKKENENKPYMSLKKLKEEQCYKDVLNIFKPEYQFLVEEAAKRLIVDVVEYESPTHQYVVQQGFIGYQEQDLISTNATIGYQTLFAYYACHRNGLIEEQVLNSKKAILLDCATFSFAEVPLEYNIILGVTGTLDTLSQPQEGIIKNIYGIEYKTFSPSVHSNDESKIFNRVQGVTIVKDSKEYYRRLVNEMDNIYLKFDRPVILFFEDKYKLEKFQNSVEFKFKKYQIIDEKDNFNEKAQKVLKATQSQQITLSTRNFGRGTDFVCYDKAVIAAGGLVVIQTFLSENLSEETQIRGRTGRQGTSGTYIMFLDLQDLSKFNIENKEIEESKNYYKTLCDFRDKKLIENQKETTKQREELKTIHERSNLVCSQMKQIVAQDIKLSQKDQQALQEHLLGLNQGQSFESEFNPMKVLVLIDCTGSMSMTLQKTKNCVGKMIKEVKQLMIKANLSEDLILMKIAGYRNYSSLEKKLFQASPEWTSNSKNLRQFLQNTLDVDGGQGNEAIEIGLQFANREIKECNGIPLQMIIIIGDMPPNTVQDVQENRENAAACENDPQYWEKTKDYKDPTHWEKELELIKEAGVPVHSFYVLNDKIEGEDYKEYLEAEFKKLNVNGGECQFLDIHNQTKGQEQLKNLFIKYIGYRAVFINQGEEAAKRAVAHIKFT